MLSLRKVAITGGLASGKSTVCRMLAELGAKVVNADAIVHNLLTPETEIGQKVIELFGKNILNNNTIDRSRVANLAFNNPRKLKMLEALLHPKVYEEINREWQEVNKEKKNALFVVEIPLLFESGGEEFFDTTVSVSSPRRESGLRFQKATGFEQEEYDRRMAFQLSTEEKNKRADIVIENSGSLEELKNQVAALYKTLAAKE